MFDDNTKLEDMLAASGIAVARFNGEVFEEDTRFLTGTENNGVLDTMPRIAVSGSRVFVAWTQNEDNDFFGTGGNINKIIAREFNGAQWGVPVTLAENLNAIVDMDAGYFGGKAQVAYVTDRDNDLETNDDRNLIVRDLTKTVTYSSVENCFVSSPKFTTIYGVQALSWYEIIGENKEASSGIRYMRAGLNPKWLLSGIDIPNNYKIMCNSAGKTIVIYPHVEDGAGSIIALLYDESTEIWGTPFKLMDMDGYAICYDGVFDDNGSFFIAYNNSRMAIVGADDVARLIEVNDLCVLQAQPLPNIRLTNVFCSNEGVCSGQPTTARALIENIGGLSLPVNYINIMESGKTVTDFVVMAFQESDEGGEWVALDGELLPGESAMIEFEMRVPDEQTNVVIEVVLSVEEFDTRDNRYTITLGYPDIALSLVKYEDNETGAITVTANVTNGTSTPANANLIVRRGAADGEILEIVELGKIAGLGSAPPEEFNIDPRAFVPEGEEFEVLYFEVIRDKQELYASNKSDFIAIFASDEPFTPDPEYPGSITGRVSSYNPRRKTIIKLYLTGTEHLVASAEIEALSEGSGQITQEFTLVNIPEGVYDLVVSKETHVNYTITGVKVGLTELNLATNPDNDINTISLPCGDINGDGFINSSDLSILILPGNYNKSTSEPGVNRLADLTGSGWVNPSALSVVILPANYNKTHSTVAYKDTEKPVTVLALVISSNTYSTIEDGHIVQKYTADIVDLNGLVHTVPVDESTYIARAAYEGKVVEFTVGNNGVYCNCAIATPDDASKGWLINTGVTAIENAATGLIGNAGGRVFYASSATIFVVVNYITDNGNRVPDGTVTIYNGRLQVPSFSVAGGLKSTYAVSYDEGGYVDQIAEIVYIYDDVYGI